MLALASLSSFISTYLAHPMHGLGYQWWSGPGSDLGELSIASVLLAGLGAWWHHHNCHVKGCPRLQWHPHPEHGHPVCRKHHPHEVTEAGRRPRQAG